MKCLYCEELAKLGGKRYDVPPLTEEKRKEAMKKVDELMGYILEGKGKREKFKL
jgi:hypothetical protein